MTGSKLLHLIDPGDIIVGECLRLKGWDVFIVGRSTPLDDILKALADSAALFNANGHTGVAVQNLRFDLSKAQKSTVNAGTATFTNVTITK